MIFPVSPERGRRLAFVLALALPFAGCDDGDPDPPTVIGTLYTMTNDAGGNEVVVYDRLDDGTLAERARVSAGGNGSGPGVEVPSDPLMSQDALILSPNGGHLFAVNAGSNSIAAFHVESDGDLDLIEAEASGGVMPIGLTVSPDARFLYVVHAMGSVDGMGAGSINGFTLDDGALAAIADAARPLSGADTTAPAVIAFSPDGSRLAVTEKMTNRIVTYSVDGNGVSGDPVVNASQGVTPFGALFTDSGTWIVSNANAPAGPTAPVPNGGSATSYAMGGDGTLSAITVQASAFGTASCWIELTPDDSYAYTTNTGSASISGYRVGGDGALTPLSQGGPLATLSVVNAAPLDMAVGDGYLYTVSGDAVGGDGTISVHRIASDGTLTPVSDQAAAGLPAFVTGLAAR